MSDSKELSVFRAAAYRLIDSDNGTIETFCLNAADVSAFEDALQQVLLQCHGDAEHEQKIMRQTVKHILWNLLYNAISRNDFANAPIDNHTVSWSVDGYSTVARIAKLILSSCSSSSNSSWCIDKEWIDDADERKRTVFNQAVRHGHTSVVELLLTHPRVDKVTIDHVNGHGDTAFLLAAAHGHTSIVELLLADPRVDKASIDHTNNDGVTALMYAADNGHSSIVELLLADPRVDKASIDHANPTGTCALLCAAASRHTSVVELLLAAPHVDKASIDRANDAGWTALAAAAAQGQTSIVELLLADPRVDKGSIDHADGDGNTALICAAANGHASIVELLLGNRHVDEASINYAGANCETALLRAGRNGHAAVVELFLAAPQVSAKSINHTDIVNNSALFYAVFYEHISVTQLLLSDSRTSWMGTVELTIGLNAIEGNEILLDMLIEELTRRQMCVIFPSRNRKFWPIPDPVDVLSDAKCDVKSSCDGAVAREASDGNVLSETPETESESDSECALITSFFRSPLFDVNVLRIIREYATYTV
jgi:ankyrin repeat protein